MPKLLPTNRFASVLYPLVHLENEHALNISPRSLPRLVSATLRSMKKATALDSSKELHPRHYWSSVRISTQSSLLTPTSPSSDPADDCSLRESPTMAADSSR